MEKRRNCSRMLLNKFTNSIEFVDEKLIITYKTCNTKNCICETFCKKNKLLSIFFMY